MSIAIVYGTGTIIFDGVLPKCKVRYWKYGIMFFDVYDVNGIWQSLPRFKKGELCQRDYEQINT
jgi:hypothetical protein